MKAFIVLKRNFTDGGFGDCVECQSDIKKVFSTKVKALEFIEIKKPFKEIDFQFGSGTEEYFLIIKDII